MKLYIWEGSGVLSDHTNGMIVALAPDMETALRLIDAKMEGISYQFPHSPTHVIDLEATPDSAAWYVHGGG